jgi:hypothetical protein
MEKNLMNSVTWNEEAVLKLTGANNQLIDIEKEKIQEIKESYVVITDEMKKNLRVNIPKILRECSSFIKEDSDFKNIHVELNRKMNEQISIYLEQTFLPKFSFFNAAHNLGIHFFEEFRSDTTKAYEQVLEFLGLPSDGRSVFPRVNANSARKSVGLQELMARTSRLMGPAYTPAKRLCNRFGLTPGRRLNQWNTKRVERSPLREDFRRHLYDEFRTDIQELEELLGRRLPWCQYAGN